MELMQSHWQIVWTTVCVAKQRPPCHQKDGPTRKIQSPLGVLSQFLCLGLLKWNKEEDSTAKPTPKHSRYCYHTYIDELMMVHLLPFKMISIILSWANLQGEGCGGGWGGLHPAIYKQNCCSLEWHQSVAWTAQIKETKSVTPTTGPQPLSTRSSQLHLHLMLPLFLENRKSIP